MVSALERKIQCNCLVNNSTDPQKRALSLPIPLQEKSKSTFDCFIVMCITQTMVPHPVQHTVHWSAEMTCF